MIALRWIAVLSVALKFGGIVTKFNKRKTRQLVGDEGHHFRITIPIRELMGQCSILSIAQSAASELFILQQKGFGGVELHSPHRQIGHILGIALTSPEPKSAPSDSQEQWEKAKKLSTKIFEQYVMLYFCNPSEMHLGFRSVNTQNRVNPWHVGIRHTE